MPTTISTSISTETPQKKVSDPHTPVAQSSAVFPSHPVQIVTPAAQVHGYYSRRPSLIDARTACSSSSSLYELNVSASNLAGIPADQVLDTLDPVSSSLMHSSSSEDDDSDTELDMDRIRSGRSNQIFKNDWSEVMGIHSPTFNPNTRQNKDDYFTQVHHIDSSTPIFKRLVSKNALKPQLKAFKRISSDLQHEMVPLENEINHEKLVLLNLKDEETLFSSPKYLSDGNSSKTSSDHEEQTSGISKFDIIKRANESWNQKKHAFLHRHSTASSSGNSSDTPPAERNEEDQERLVRKRSSFENGHFEFGDNAKRRAVSTSPVSAGFLRRGSIKLITKASNELEKMSLKNE